MKIGIVCSAGGSACCSALDILIDKKVVNSTDVLIVTDRTCKAEQEAEKRGIKCVRLEYNDATDFSSKACSKFRAAGSDLVFLFYTRRVTEELFRKIPTLNIHPSLLPAFPGLDALGQARKHGVRFLGATAHNVIAVIDDGPILAQVMTPVKAESTEQDFGRLSYVQKTYLMLCMVDLFQHGFLKVDTTQRQCHWVKKTPSISSANPCIITDSIIDAFAVFQSELGVEAIDL